MSEPVREGRVAVFDCFSGIAGDMTVAAAVDAGASLEAVLDGLMGLRLPAFALRTEAVTRGGLRARLLHVDLSEEQTYQADEMIARIEGAGLPPRVRERALAAVRALARGEALAHGVERPHLHEAGGVDALIDIVGSMLALEELGVVEVHCPVVTVGAGTIARTAHGAIPAAPGPAAAHVLREAGFPLRFVEAGHELVTPTGAAILAAVAKPGAVTISTEAMGAGAGTFDPPGRPNALRIFVGRVVAEAGTAAPLGATRALVQLETNIDDMPAALLANARDRLLEEGALDAWLEPIGMKKGRAATKLCALVNTADEARMAELFLAETTTLGVRATDYRRYEANRHVEQMITSLGAVQVKVSEHAGRRRMTPEFEDVRRLAKTHGLPALEVQRRLELELSGSVDGAG